MEPTFIDKLKEKPRHKRHMYAGGTSLVVVAAIFVVWITVKSPFNVGAEQVIAQEKPKQNTQSLITDFGESVAGVFEGFKSAVGSVKSMFGAKEKYEAEELDLQTE